MALTIHAAEFNHHHHKRVSVTHNVKMTFSGRAGFVWTDSGAARVRVVSCAREPKPGLRRIRVRACIRQGSSSCDTTVNSRLAPMALALPYNKIAKRFNSNFSRSPLNFGTMAATVTSAVSKMLVLTLLACFYFFGVAKSQRPGIFKYSNIRE